MAIREEINYIFTYIKSSCNTEISIDIARAMLEYKDVTSLSVGQQIRHFRILKNLTQEQLAGEIGVVRTYMSQIESDSKFPSLEVLKHIIEVLDIKEKIVIPKYKLFLMNSPNEKLKKFKEDNQISNHKLAQILHTNSTYVKRWVSGETVISQSVYEKLNTLGIE